MSQASARNTDKPVLAVGHVEAAQSAGRRGPGASAAQAFQAENNLIDFNRRAARTFGARKTCPETTASGSASPVSYLHHAQASLAAASSSPDAVAAALHAKECELWLILARQRRAIEAVLTRYAQELDAPEA